MIHSQSCHNLLETSTVFVICKVSALLTVRIIEKIITSHTDCLLIILTDQISNKCIASFLGMTPVTLSKLRRILREKENPKA